MHIVYEISFPLRTQNDQYPNKYLGIKSNAIVKDNKIIDRRGRVYAGSSRHKKWKNVTETEQYVVKVLYESHSWADVIEKEEELHSLYQVDLNEEYFNMSKASSEANKKMLLVGLGSYKHHKFPDKRVRLPKDHPDVVNGTFVGITKGRVMPPEERERRKGKPGTFKGKKHSEETKKVQSRSKKGKPRPKWTDEGLNNQREAARASCMNKSEEHERNFRSSTKGKSCYINLITGQRKMFKEAPSSKWMSRSFFHYNKSVVKSQCKVCDLISTHEYIERYHNDKCKNNKENY